MAGSTRNRVVRGIDAHGEDIDGVHYRNCNVVEFDGRTFLFSHRAILTLVVVSQCNAGCRFCSNEITFTPTGPFLSWDERLERIRDFALLSGVRKIAYTGGEPTLRPQMLFELMAAMNRGFGRSRLHTNGYGLFRDVATPDGDRPLLDAMISVGLTGVSVSVAHHEQAVNREIMRLDKRWTGMSEEALIGVHDRASASFTPRLSCVMTAEGIHDVDGIFDYLDWGRELGYRRFIFRSCSEIPDDFKKPTEFSSYNDRNLIPIDALTEKIAARPGVERTFRQRKSDSKVDVYQWGDITFDIDESSEEPDPDPKIRRLNVMPNGIAYTSWIDPMSTLFEADRDSARGAMLVEFGNRPRTPDREDAPCATSS